MNSALEDEPRLFRRFKVQFFYGSGSSRFGIFRFVPSLIMGGNEIFVNIWVHEKKNSDFLSRFHISWLRFFLAHWKHTGHHSTTTSKWQQYPLNNQNSKCKIMWDCITKFIVVVYAFISISFGIIKFYKANIRMSTWNNQRKGYLLYIVLVLFSD